MSHILSAISLYYFHNRSWPSDGVVGSKNRNIRQGFGRRSQRVLNTLLKVVAALSLIQRREVTSNVRLCCKSWGHGWVFVDPAISTRRRADVCVYRRTVVIAPRTLYSRPYEGLRLAARGSGGTPDFRSGMSRCLESRSIPKVDEL